MPLPYISGVPRKLHMPNIFPCKFSIPHANFHPRGCTTSRVIANVMKKLTSNGENELDPDALDGWDELPPAEQAKVLRALKQGHIDEEDSKMDPEEAKDKKSPDEKKKPAARGRKKKVRC